MDNDDEIMFFQMMAEDAALEENEMVMAAVLDATVEANAVPKFGGSVKGRRAYQERHGATGHILLYNDYFAQNPANFPHEFCRLFRMSRDMFRKIVHGVREYDDYFELQRDCIGLFWFSSLQKCMAAIWCLAYGLPADALNDYLRMSKSTAVKVTYRFCKAVVKVFGVEYLRSPNEADTAHLLAQGQARGSPGLLGSIDCMHWNWKNCLFAWQGMYKSGHHGKCSVILEAVADYDLWIWHAFFQHGRAADDINMLQRFPVFKKFCDGLTLPYNYVINGHEYTKGYYLADDIYPTWSTIVKTIRNPVGEADCHFAKSQESVHKDVERAFGVLQARFSVVRYPCLSWSIDEMCEIMEACVIMHNMIIESERDTRKPLINEVFDFQGPMAEPQSGVPKQYSEFLAMHREIRDGKCISSCTMTS